MPLKANIRRPANSFIFWSPASQHRVHPPGIPFSYMIPENPPWTIADRFSSHHMLPLPHLKEAEISFQGKVSPCIKELLKRMKDLAPPSPTSPSFLLCYWMLEKLSREGHWSLLPKSLNQGSFSTFFRIIDTTQHRNKAGFIISSSFFFPSTQWMPC